MVERKSSRAQVTVCLPVKAHDARYLREAVDSIASQSSDAWELLIVVEPEVSEPVSQVLAGRLGDPRVRVLENEGRRLAGAFNTGMRHAGDRVRRDPARRRPLGAERSRGPAALDRAPSRRSTSSTPPRIVVDERGRPVSDVHPARSECRLEDFAPVVAREAPAVLAARARALVRRHGRVARLGRRRRLRLPVDDGGARREVPRRPRVPLPLPRPSRVTSG